MILVDANILIYAYSSATEHHAPARSWVDVAFGGTEQIGLAWPVIYAFIRLATNTRIFANPYSIEEAVAIVDEWLEQPNAVLLDAGRAHWPIARSVLIDAQVRADLVSDAQLAALAVEHDATIYTADRDFRRFKGVRVENPLV